MKLSLDNYLTVVAMVALAVLIVCLVVAALGATGVFDWPAFREVGRYGLTCISVMAEGGESPELYEVWSEARCYRIDTRTGGVIEVEMDKSGSPGPFSR